LRRLADMLTCGYSVFWSYPSHQGTLVCLLDFRFTVFRGDDTSVLFLCAHHVIVMQIQNRLKAAQVAQDSARTQLAEMKAAIEAEKAARLDTVSLRSHPPPRSITFFVPLLEFSSFLYLCVRPCLGPRSP
jgi:hypothetical protein